jgi:hypothetical protein
MNKAANQVPYPVGLRIVNVRWMTQEEADVEGWDISWNKTAVMEMNDGSKIYASQDAEGNGAGWLVGVLDDSTSVEVVPMESIR